MGTTQQFCDLCLSVKRPVVTGALIMRAPDGKELTADLCTWCLTVLGDITIKHGWAPVRGSNMFYDDRGILLSDDKLPQSVTEWPQMDAIHAYG